MVGWNPSDPRGVQQLPAWRHELRAGSRLIAPGRRSGTHEQVGLLRVRDLLHESVHHRNHTRQMLANVQAAVWPHMANAQRFVGE